MINGCYRLTDVADGIFGGCPIAETGRMKHSLKAKIFVKLRPMRLQSLTTAVRWTTEELQKANRVLFHRAFTAGRIVPVAGDHAFGALVVFFGIVTALSGVNLG